MANLPQEGIKDIDHAWEYLEAAFGNPYSSLNYRMNKIKAIPGLTRNIEENDAQQAADWYLDYENAVKSVLMLGNRDTELQAAAFNVQSLYIIVSKLPFNLVNKTYDITGCSGYNVFKLRPNSGTYSYSCGKPIWTQVSP